MPAISCLVTHGSSLQAGSTHVGSVGVERDRLAVVGEEADHRLVVCRHHHPQARGQQRAIRNVRLRSAEVEGALHGDGKHSLLHKPVPLVAWDSTHVVGEHEAAHRRRQRLWPVADDGDAAAAAPLCKLAEGVCVPAPHRAYEVHHVATIPHPVRCGGVRCGGPQHRTLCRLGVENLLRRERRGPW